MVETAIYVLLGFLAATLLALISVPAISRRAFRLAEARARLMAPASAAQARADLDALRGRHAIEIVSAERSAAAAQDELSAARIELGRRSATIFARDKEISAKSEAIARQNTEIARYCSLIREQDTEISTREIGLHDLMQQRDAAGRRLAEAHSTLSAHETRLAENRATIAALETRIAGALAELADLKRKSESAAARAEAEIGELSARLDARGMAMKTLEAQFADLEARHTLARSEAEGRASEAARLRERLAEIEPRLAKHEKMREALALESSRLAARATERDAEVQRLLALRREETEWFHDRLAAAATRENELAIRVQALNAGRLESDGALRAVRAQHDVSSRELVALRETSANAAVARPLANGDQILRQAIVRLGRELVESDASSDLVGFSDAEIISFGRREAINSANGETERSAPVPRASEARVPEA